MLLLLQISTISLFSSAMEGQRGSNSSLSSGNGNEVAADVSSCFYVPNPSGTDFDAESSSLPPL